ncbi:hypothetical protein MTR_7g089960 [Medicago truncatula]|uniref:Uncharacterized protein n=1 Tax=Medicago truncatula TaxID=3880 RepID=G7KQT4_MEDTR|nr:hypothetical protein MTR_7g089960 [Medicago truncatula]
MGRVCQLFVPSQMNKGKVAFGYWKSHFFYLTIVSSPSPSPFTTILKRKKNRFFPQKKLQAHTWLVYQKSKLK